MTLNITVPKTEYNLAPKITVIGVGGAGGNAVNNMIQSNVEGVEFLISNTDAQALGLSLCERRIQMGRNITQGLGAGSRPDIGRAAAEEQLDEILAELDGANMVFITAGMGGGTGTGAAPVIARAAREAGILTVGVVTKPFQFEGVHRMRMAEAGITEMTQYVDTLIVIPNQNLFRVANEKTTFADAFKMADDVLRSGVRGVTDLMVMPGLINLDFADIRSVMTEMGKAMMGTGEAEGENRALNAAEAAISNPLLDDVSMKGARGVLINISGGMDLTLFEVDETANRIRDEVDPDANIIFGAIFDQSLEGRMRVSVVATGIEAEAAEAPIPSQTPLSLVSDQGAPRIAGFGGSGSAAGAPAASAAQVYEPAYEIQAEPVAQNEPSLAGEEPAVLSEVAPQDEYQGNRLYAYSQTTVPEDLVSDDRLSGAMAEVEAESAAPAVPAEGPDSMAAGRRHDVFIAPKAIEASMEAELDSAHGSADPFAAAAVSNGSPAQEVNRPSLGFDRKKAQRLFQSVKENAAKALSAATQASEPREARRSEPSLDESSRDSRRPADPISQPAGQAGTQPGLTGFETATTAQTTGEEEDFLDIPAFLRRQAN